MPTSPVRKPLRWALFAICLIPAGSVPAEPSVTVHGARFRVEVAATPEQVARGLMFREHLDADQGMLFVYSRPTFVRFWMKNTRIPLDILYFDADRRLLKVFHSVPPCVVDPCRQYPSGEPVRFVLELNGGTAKQVGIEAGDVLDIEF
jgi:uncharacterized membrane protein (UPF0127 family)